MKKFKHDLTMPYRGHIYQNKMSYIMHKRDRSAEILGINPFRKLSSFKDQDVRVIDIKEGFVLYEYHMYGYNRTHVERIKDFSDMWEIKPIGEM